MVLKQTPLHALNLAKGCRMVPFAGWEMPIQFAGLIKEHQAVRNKAGLFDISHMGILLLQGVNVKNSLQFLVPSDLERIGPGEACYSLLLNEKGGIIDDLIIYDLGTNNEGQENLLLVINASCAESDTAWIKKNLNDKNISISNAKENKVLIAIQGPKARDHLQKLFEDSITNIPSFGHRQMQLKKTLDNKKQLIFIARTGYTGEDGYEMIIPSDVGKSIWQNLIDSDVTPCGLGARDTLRLEAGMHLYGNDMNSETTPFEASLGWLVHLEMQKDFLGRNVLEQQAQEGIKRKLVGLKLQGRAAIARQGYKIIHEKEVVGRITSGTWSPTLKEAIAMGYLPTELAKIGCKVEVEIRNEKHLATVVKRPFYRKIAEKN